MLVPDTFLIREYPWFIVLIPPKEWNRWEDEITEFEEVARKAGNQIPKGLASKVFYELGVFVKEKD